MTEIEKMINGKIYDSNDKELIAKRKRAHALCKKYNETLDKNQKRRNKIIHQLLPNHQEGLYLQGPIYIDYGEFITFGKHCYANFNLTILDTCPVNIGDNVYIGPNVSIFTPKHPLYYNDRNMYFDKEKGYWTDKEYASPIKIGDNCWICGNVTICGGVTIGSGSVIGAGSVVVKDIPENSLAFGNPCKVQRKIVESDKLEFKQELFV